MSDSIDWIGRSGAKPKGKRPDFLGNANQEKMLSMLMAVIAEVSVLRERLDTVERLLEAKGSLTRDDIERYAPDLATGKERNQMTRAYIARVMRGVQQEMEALANPEPSIDEIVDELTH
jgi:hypothetical protein